MPMTRQQAELAVDRNPRLRGLGTSREAAILQVMRMEPEELTGKVPAGSPLARSKVPQPAILAAMGGPEEPKMVTPAAPAPMRPGIPVMAPRPEAKPLPQPDAAPAPRAPSSFTSPARVAAREAERELDLLNQVAEALIKEGQPVPPEARIRLERAQQRLASATAEANAEESAQIDPERAAILARQQGQIKDEEARIASDVKRSPWEAMTQGGLALMNPERGAGFISALSSGLGTGLNAYTASKADAIERRARLQKETNSAELQRLDALTKARADAVAAIRRGEDVDERTMRMSKMTNEEIADVSLRPFAIQKAKADASRAQTQAEFEPQVIQSDIDYKGAMGAAAGVRASNTGGGGSDGPTPTSLLRTQNEAERKASELRIKAANAFSDWKEETGGTADQQKGAKWDKYDAIRREYRYWRDKAGRSSPFAGKAKAGATAKPKVVNFSDL